jgi:hypothetical protein
LLALAAQRSLEHREAVEIDYAPHETEAS